MSTEQEFRKLVNQECNALLSAQVSILCSADTKAMGLLAASAAITGIAFATIAGVQTASAGLPLLWWGAFGAAIPAFLAGCAAVWAGWTRYLLMPGWGPADFMGDKGRTESEIVSDMLSLNQDKIDANNDAIQEITRRNQLALLLLASTPFSILAALAWPSPSWRWFALFVWGGMAIGVVWFFVPERFRTPR